MIWEHSFFLPGQPRPIQWADGLLGTHCEDWGPSRTSQRLPPYSCQGCSCLLCLFCHLRDTSFKVPKGRRDDRSGTYCCHWWTGRSDCLGSCLASWLVEEPVPGLPQPLSWCAEDLPTKDLPIGITFRISVIIMIMLRLMILSFMRIIAMAMLNANVDAMALWWFIYNGSCLSVCLLRFFLF